MMINSLHKRWVMRFFVLIYLLLSFGTANASFWCHAEQSSPRLESGPMGSCWTACGSEDVGVEQKGLAETGLPSIMPEGGCFDLKVYSSVLTSSTRPNLPNRILVLDIDSVDSPFIVQSGLEASTVVRQSLPSRLPPTQTSASLRTVVLLH